MSRCLSILILASAVLAAGCGLVLGLDDLEHPVGIADGGGDPDGPDEAGEEGETEPDIDAADEIEAEADPPADDVGPVDPLPDDACPPDGPTHRYIAVSGSVRNLFSMTGTESVDGLHIGLYSAMDVYLNPELPPLGEGLVEGGPSGYEGTFDLACIDVAGVTLGLVAVVDEDASSTASDFFPTATLVVPGAGGDMADEETGMAVAVIDAAVEAFQMMIEGLDPENGLIIGMVVETDTYEGLAGASVTSTGPGVNVHYPDETFTGFRIEGTTASHGVFVIAGPVSLAQLTAALGGYVFDSTYTATVSGICTFTFIPGSAAP